VAAAAARAAGADKIKEDLGMGLFKQLWVQVLLATLAGIALGHWWPKLGADMKPLGDAFIALIRMLIAPVIFCTVVHGVAAMNDMRRVGRVALKALIYFEVITSVALVLGLAAVNILKPGAGMHVAANALDVQAVSQYTARAHSQGIAQFFLDIIPATFLDAFAHTEVLPVLLVSVLFAAGLAACGERGKAVHDVIDSVREVFFRIVGFVMSFVRTIKTSDFDRRLQLLETSQAAYPPGIEVGQPPLN
jgi:aerobic C4-dicarboxylate transport protein